MDFGPRCREEDGGTAIELATQLGGVDLGELEERNSDDNSGEKIREFQDSKK